MENDLSKWLQETKELNLDYKSLVKRIASSPYSRVYQKLDGYNSNMKATSLFNRWRREPKDNDVSRIVTTLKDEMKNVDYGSIIGYERPFSGILSSKKVIKEKPKKEVKYLNDKDFLIPSGTKIHYRSQPESSFITHIYPEEPQYIYVESASMKISPFEMRMSWRGRTIENFNNSLKDREIIIDNLSQDEQDKLLGVWNNIILTSDAKYISNESEIDNYRFEYKNPSRNYFIVTPGVTANCQIAAVAYAHTIILYSSDIKKQFAELYKCGRNILLLDLNKRYIDELKKHVSKYIIGNMPYQSTNGSEMEIFLIDVRKLFIELNKNEQK